MVTGYNLFALPISILSVNSFSETRFASSNPGQMDGFCVRLEPFWPVFQRRSRFFLPDRREKEWRRSRDRLCGVHQLTLTQIAAELARPVNGDQRPGPAQFAGNGSGRCPGRSHSPGTQGS